MNEDELDSLASNMLSEVQPKKNIQMVNSIRSRNISPKCSLISVSGTIPSHCALGYNQNISTDEQHSRKFSEDMHIILKNAVTDSKMVVSTTMPSYSLVPDSLHLSNDPSLSQSIVISQSIGSDTNSMNSLQTSLKNVSDSFNLPGTTTPERGISSCENSLSDLTATITTPVNMIDCSTDSLIFDGHSSIKDEFPTVSQYSKDSSSLLQHSLKEEKNISSETSNHLMTNVTNSLPSTINELSKITSNALKSPILNTTSIFQDRSTDKLVSNATSCFQTSHIGASHDLQSLNNFRIPTPLSDNFLNCQSGSAVITSAPHTVSQNCQNNMVITESKPLHSINFQQPNSLTDTLYNSDFQSNNVNRIQNIQLPILADTIVDKDVKRVLPQSNTVDNLTKDIKHIFSEENLSKTGRISDNLTSNHTPARSESLLMSEQIMNSSITSDMVVDSQLSFIHDHQHDHLLSNISQIHDITNRSVKDSRPIAPEDIFLSDLHTSDENELSLEGSLTSALGSHHVSSNISSSNPVVSEVPLTSNSVSHLQELPSSPIMANISSDLLVGGSSVPKTSPSLSSATDLALTFSSHFDNSNMSIDMGSLSEGDTSLILPSHSDTSLDTPKKMAGISELSFTNALKNATEKPSGFESPRNKNHSGKESSLLQNNIESMGGKCSLSSSSNSSSEMFKIPPQSLDLSYHLVKSKSPNRDHSASPSSNSSIERLHGKISPKFSYIKEEPIPMAQRVSCFKCQICSFLSLDKYEMSEHTRLQHGKKKTAEIPLENQQFSSIDKDCSPHLAKIPKTNSSLKRKDFIPTTLFEDHSSDSSTDIKVYRDNNQHELVNNIPQINESNSNDKSKLFAKVSSTGKDISNTKLNSMKQKATTSQTTTTRSKKNLSLESTPEFKCGINGCGLKLKKEENIIYHRKCHTDAFLTCPECKTKFSNWASLSMHIWKIHLIDIELHKCEKCSYKSYSYTKLMNGHWRTHSNERPFLCDACGKNFKTAKQLRGHKVLHSEKKEDLKHHCKICNRKFAEKRMLLSHSETVHKKVKPYLCNYCGNSFASKSTLNLHIRIHTGEKPFACEHCNYKTSDHNSMRRHKMKHTNDRRYSCPYCEYTSIQSSTFKVHLKRNHETQAQNDGIIFSCPFCKFKTVKKDNILAHIGTVHKISDEEREKLLKYNFQIPQWAPDPLKVEQMEIKKETHKKSKKTKKENSPVKRETHANLEDPEVETMDKEILNEESHLINSNLKTVKVNGNNVMSVQNALRNGQPQTFYVISELVPVQHVNSLDELEFNADVDNGVTLLEACNIVNPISSEFLLDEGENFSFTEVNSFSPGSILHSVNVADQPVHLTPEVVALPLTTGVRSLVKGTNCVEDIHEVVYVSSSDEVICNL